jgi:hypothetical protein
MGRGCSTPKSGPEASPLKESAKCHKQTSHQRVISGMTISDSASLASNMVYFSFGTLTTAGSGDIAPMHAIGRSLVNIQAMIGQLYPATLLARLVTLEIENEADR